MELATLRDGTPDGRLHVVSSDLTRAAPAAASKTLQPALEDWTRVVADLTVEYDALNAGKAANANAFGPSAAMAPLPRAWQWLDGSAFESHGNLKDTIFGIKKERTNRPLMYQGVSDHFYGATDDIPLPSEGDDIDFEGEYGVITTACRWVPPSMRRSAISACWSRSTTGRSAGSPRSR